MFAESGEIGMDIDFFAISGPVSPDFFPCRLIAVHDASVNGLPRREDITREIKLGGKG